MTPERIGAVHEYVTGIDEVERLSKPFTPEAVATITGIGADTIRRVAHELADAPTACVYGRIGTCTQEFGTLASWLIDVINVCTGNSTSPVVRCSRRQQRARPTRAARRASDAVCGSARRHSRVRACPNRWGSSLRLFSPRRSRPKARPDPRPAHHRGNPVCSIPNGGGRLDRALDTLEFMVSVDIYVNETTRTPM